MHPDQITINAHLSLEPSEVEALKTALFEYIEDFNGEYDPDSEDGLTEDDREFLAALRRVQTRLEPRGWDTDVCVCGHDFASHDPDTEGCDDLGLCAECLAVQP